MADVSLDWDDLRGAVTNLRYVAQQFTASDSTSESAALAVGHSGLASQLLEFADNWDDKREDFAGACSGLADRYENIVNGFQGWDTGALHGR